MADGFTRSPKLLKGALVELSEPFLGPVPNIIVFQYNPETMTRTLTPWSAGSTKAGSAGKEEESRSQPFDPGEKFSLNLLLDAADALEEPEKHPVAVISGVADRVSALEMLLYPAKESFLGEFFGSLAGTVDVVPRGTVPVVLFVWGPGRIVPVRLTSFSVDEQLYSPTLYPIRAKVTVGLQVLTSFSFHKVARPLSASEEMAVKAYEFTRKQKEVLARANLANSVESILGLLPF